MTFVSKDAEINFEDVKFLNDVIKKREFTYKKIQGNDHAFIYAQFDNENLNKPVAFEVFRKMIVKNRWDNEVFKYRIPYPGNEDFGYWAWTYRDLERAETKYAVLTATGEANENR